MDGLPTRRDVLRGLGTAALAGGAVGSAASQEGYEPLGSVGVPGAKEAVVGYDHAFLATGDGFAVVDIADPAEPSVVYENRSVLADREGGPLGDIQDVKVDGNRLLVAGPANGATDLNAFVLYDVSDPAAPERVGAVETEFFHHNTFLRDGYAYLASNDGEGNPLVVYDGTTEEVGRWGLLDANEGWRAVPAPLKTLHDIYVRDGVAYLAYWDAGTYIVDVGNPATPELLTKLRGPDPSAFEGMDGSAARRESFLPPGNDHYVTVNEDATLLGVGMESWGTDGEGGPSGIDLYDIADPTAAEKVGTVAPPPTDDPTFGGTWTTAHNFEFAAGRLYAAWYAGGVRLLDVSDPATPEELRAWRDSDSTSFWTAQAARPGEFFLASSRGDPSEGSGDGGRVYTFPEPDLPAQTTTRAPTSTTATDGNGVEPYPVSTPGFGVTAALGALGLGAAYHLLRN